MNTITFNDECTGSCRNQIDRLITLKINGQEATWAQVDTDEYGEHPRIKYIETQEEMRRMGAAQALMEHIQSIFPGQAIRLTMATDEGAAMLNSLTWEEVPNQHTPLFDAYPDLVAKRDAMIKQYDAIHDAAAQRPDGKLTEEEKTWMHVNSDPLNNLHDQIAEVENQIRGETKFDRLIVQTGGVDRLASKALDRLAPRQRA